MDEQGTLETQVYVLSFYDYAIDDPAEHILGFYSSEKNAEGATQPLRQADFNDEFHITPMTIVKLIEGAHKALVECGPEVGYGHICTSGHTWEYPWVHTYTEPEEILELLDKPAITSYFLPRSR